MRCRLTTSWRLTGLWCFCLAGVAGCLILCGHAEAQPSADAGSTYRRSLYHAGDVLVQNGHVVHLLRSSAEVAVSFRDGIDPNTALNMLRRSSGLSALRRTGATTPSGPLLLGMDGSQTKPRSRIHIHSINSSPVVAYSYAVLVEPEYRTLLVPTPRLTVCLNDDTMSNEQRSAFADLGVVPAGRPLPSHPNIYSVVLADPKLSDPLVVAARLTTVPGVVWAEPDFIRELRPAYEPLDPFFASQWSLENNGQNSAHPDIDVDASGAWDDTLGSTEVVIAIIDDGVDVDHPDLLIQPGGYDFANDDDDPDSTGSDGHGTACAGLAAGCADNGVGLAGMAAGCRILPVKIIENTPFASNETIAQAIYYAAERADVLCCGWTTSPPSSIVNAAIDHAYTNGREGLGCPIFFPSGNGASRWYESGLRVRISLAGLTGRYRFGFAFHRGPDGQSGTHVLLIDDVCLLESDGFTHRWREDFESGIPSGWSEDGTDFWALTAPPMEYRGTAGHKSLFCTGLLEGAVAVMRTHEFDLEGNEYLAFAMAKMAPPDNQDGLYVEVRNHIGTIVEEFELFGGITTANSAVEWPASHGNAIAVGASSDCERRSDYSAYGAELDFLAPSNGGWNDLITTDPLGVEGMTSGDYNFGFGGTSGACSLASGIAALMISKNRSLVVSDLRDVMRETCREMDGATYDANGFEPESGYGLVNAHDALAAIGTSAVDHYGFDGIDSQLPMSGFELTITARNAIGRVEHNFDGWATLSAMTGNASPPEVYLSDGVWSGTVTIDQCGAGISLHIEDDEGHFGNTAEFAAVSAITQFAVTPTAEIYERNVPFALSVTARDACYQVLEGYAECLQLHDPTGTIEPIEVCLGGGQWSGMITPTSTGCDVTIQVEDDNGIMGQSLAFDVLPPAPRIHEERPVTFGLSQLVRWASSEPEANHMVQASLDDADFTTPMESEWKPDTFHQFTGLQENGTYYYRTKSSVICSCREGTRTLESQWSNVTWSQQVLVGDHDGDGDVDLEDFRQLLICMNYGEDYEFPPVCAPYDYNSNNMIDLADFLIFQVSFTGPLTP